MEMKEPETAVGAEPAEVKTEAEEKQAAEETEKAQEEENRHHARWR